ncbi:Ig-like domain-containing protein [Anaerovorax odorimutans]|uniref:Ig-like domain-containing protein n=1 Tax=Anaerovorax odorimutans TaxID=109327 RepID=A0ABT1RJL8_9FIRM|nr:Ig-like domain-containing protein [Anaerovorax odorimutans]MCQ4635391.1 Ig-like domain-containing protein [Anaerovorax odorimutans]
MESRKKTSSKLLSWLIAIAVTFTMTFPTAFVWGATAPEEPAPVAETTAPANDADKETGANEETAAAAKQAAQPASNESRSEKQASGKAAANGAVKINELSEITGSGNYQIENNIEITVNNDDPYLTIPEGWDVTLDLNGKEIKVISPQYGSIAFINEGKLTIKDSGTNGEIITETLSLLKNMKSGSVIVDGGTFRTAYTGGAVLFNSSAQGKLTINGGTVDAKGYGVYNTGICTINGGSFHSTSSSVDKLPNADKGFYAYCIRNSKEMTINNATVTGIQGAVACAAGKIVIRDGHFSAEKGNNKSFYALYVAGEEGESAGEVYGGTFYSPRNAVHVGNDNAGGDGGIRTKATAKIFGGTFTGEQGAIEYEKLTGKDPYIKAGIFNTNPIEYIANDSFVTKTDGNYQVAPVDISWYDADKEIYTIGTAADLAGLAYLTNTGLGDKKIDFKGKTIKLGSDIDLTGVDWTPIGSGASSSQISEGTYGKINVTCDNPFRGVFDGQNHTIKNLTMDGKNYETKEQEKTSYGKYIGLFTATENAEIRNLTLEAVRIDNAGAFAAPVVSFAASTVMDNVKVTGKSSVSGQNAAGLAACLIDTKDGKQCEMKDCSSTADLTVSGNTAGIIAGGLIQQISSGWDRTVVIDGCQYTGLINIDAKGTAYIWAGGLYGGTSFEEGGFTLKVKDCSNSESNIKVTNQGSLPGAFFGTTSQKTEDKDSLSGTRMEFFGGLLGRTHYNVEVVVFDRDGIHVGVSGQLEYKTAAAAIGDRYYVSVAAAVDAAKAGDIIEIAEGTHSEDLTVNKDITLRGKGEDKTILKGKIDLTGGTSAFENLKVENRENTTYENALITLKGEQPSTARFEHCTIHDNETAFRMESKGSALTLKDTDVKGEDRYGIGIRNEGQTLTVEGGTIEGWGAIMTSAGGLVEGKLENSRVKIKITGATIVGIAQDNDDYGAITLQENFHKVQLDVEDTIFNTEKKEGQTGAKQSCLTIRCYDSIINLSRCTFNNKLAVKPGAALIHSLRNTTKGYEEKFNEVPTKINIENCKFDYTPYNAEKNEGTYPIIKRGVDVVKIDGTSYNVVDGGSINDAIHAAKDGDTIRIQAGTYDEKVNPFPESNHSQEKSISLMGANSENDPNKSSWFEKETILTGGMYLGYDDSHTRNNSITVKGITFRGNGLTVADEKDVTISNNKFVGIQPASDGNANAIAVLDQELSDLRGNATISNNRIEGVTAIQGKAGMGINLRNPYNATVTNNYIKDTEHNGILFQKNSSYEKNTGQATITGNILVNWDSNDDSTGGRALRLDFRGNKEGDDSAKSISVTGNIFDKPNMISKHTDPDFVKITGIEKCSLDLTKNYWNSAKPDFKSILTVTSDDGQVLSKNVSPFYIDKSLSESSLRSDIRSVDLDKIKATLHKGETLQLSALVSPSDAYDKSVEWTSSDKSIATVDASGMVKAVAPGSAEITAAAVNGEKDVCKIRVINETVAAKIGSEPYDSLESAIAAAEAGDTVTIVSDITLSQPITIGKAITLTDDGDRTITVDYEPKDGKAPIQTPVSGVTIKDLNVVLNYNSFNIVHCAGQAITLQNNTFKAKGVNVALRKPFNSIGGGSKLIGNTVISGNKAWDGVPDKNGILSVRTKDPGDAKEGEIIIKDNHFENFYKGISLDNNGANVPVTVTNNKFLNVNYAFEMSKNQKNDGYSFMENYNGGAAPKVLDADSSAELAGAPSVLPYYKDAELTQLVTAIKAVKLNATKMDVKQGNQAQLIAAVIPETEKGEYDTGIQWSAEAGKGASVDEQGVVSIEEGAEINDKVVVTAAAKGNGAKYATCEITILAKTDDGSATHIQPTVKDQRINSDDVKMAIGNTAKGQDIVVVAPEEVPAPIIEQDLIASAKANESNLIIETRNKNDNLKATFSFDAKTIKDTSIAVKTGITKKEIAEKPVELGSADITGISLEHEGGFPGLAVITVALPDQNINADSVYVYHLQKDNSLKLVDNGALPVKKDSSGTKTVTFRLLHASDYVFSSAPMKASAAKALVEQEIEAISRTDEISYTHQWDAKIKDARAAYDGFKAQYPDKAAMLGSDEVIVAAERKYEAMDAQVEAFRKSLKAFEGVSGVLSRYQQQDADKLKEDYERLDADQKASLKDVQDQYNYVLELEAGSKVAENRVHANRVIKAVEQLPINVVYSAEDKKKIDAARNVYNSVVSETPGAKALLTEELKKIEAAEAAYRSAETAYKTARRNTYSGTRISLAAAQYTYDGRAKTPKVNGLSGFVKGTDYVISYKNNVKTGKATVTVTAKGDFAGLRTKTATFRIIPAKAAISKLKGGAKSFKVTVKSQKNTGVTGYQIAYSKKKNKGFKKVNTTKTSKKIKKLKAEQKYYVKVRAYKRIDGKNYYGAYSKVKRIKTK